MCSLAAAGESQTLEKQALATELERIQELKQEADDSIIELKQSVCMWQELCQTLRDENSDLTAQVAIFFNSQLKSCSLKFRNQLICARRWAARL